MVSDDKFEILFVVVEYNLLPPVSFPVCNLILAPSLPVDEGLDREELATLLTTFSNSLLLMVFVIRRK